MSNKLVLALPKGRILKELSSILNASDIIPEESFFDENSRSLRFSTNDPDIDVIRVRSFDVASFVSSGVASAGIVGKDVLKEFDSEEIYSPLGLFIGKCRLSLAAKKSDVEKFLIENNIKSLPSEGAIDLMLKDTGHISVATKYPNITNSFFADRGVQAECIKLNGSIEIAADLGLCDYIVDLVSTGNTLRINNLVEIGTMLDVSSYLIFNRVAFKTQKYKMNKIYDNFKNSLMVS